MKAIQTRSFIERAIEIHGKVYDYSKVEYKNNKTKICIICPKHGEFWQVPKSHLSGRGCSRCKGIYIPTTEEVIKKAKKVHGEQYDYSKVEYKNNKTKICIICPKHGEFWQTPTNHINDKSGCFQCGREKQGIKRRKKQEVFLKEVLNIHDNKYDYSKVVYIKAHEKIIIICRSCGLEFNQTPNTHLKGHGCLKCYSNNIVNKRNKITIKGNYAEVTLYYDKNYIIEKGVFLIDVKDIHLIKNDKWHSCNKNYVKSTFTGKPLQRIILGIEDDNLMADHIDGNPLDNRRKNLRIVTPQQNAFNRKKTIKNKSGFPGIAIYKRKNGESYRISIVVNGKQIRLGTRYCLEEAKKVRIAAEEKYFGEYRRVIK